MLSWTRGLSHRARLVAVLGAFVVFLTMGVRQSFGLFVGPITEGLNMGRESFSLAIALQNLIFGLPLVGMLADRLDPRRVVIASGSLYAVGLIIAAWLASPFGMFVSFAPLVGLALSGASFVVVLGAVGQEIPAERRGSVFGMITAAGSLGLFAVVPGAQVLLEALGWRSAMALIGGLMVLVVAAGWLLPRGRPEAPEAQAPESLLRTLDGARRNPNYLLLVTGFFVCGFHVAFIATHLTPYLTDNGIDARTGAFALSLIGLFNIVGSVTFGSLGDRYRKRTLLALLYGLRAVVITFFLVVPLTSATALVFGCMIGFLWLATVPLTSGVVAQLFGARYLSTLFGFVFLSHQIGAFLGVWLGGRVFDASGSYRPIWLVAIGLALLATLIHLPIKEDPVAAPASDPAKGPPPVGRQ